LEYGSGEGENGFGELTDNSGVFVQGVTKQKEKGQTYGLIIGSHSNVIFE
jgi:hypothetical protein